MKAKLFFQILPLLFFASPIQGAEVAIDVGVEIIAKKPSGKLPTSYLLKDNVVGPGFYQFFDFQAIKDPTHGRVTYVEKQTAIKENLTYASWDTFILRTDSKTTLSADGPGRNSVRIRSKKTYTTHLAIFNVRHMPQGCATWPAIWEVKESNWPSGGEIDVVEGVNDQTDNFSTIHSVTGCSMPPNRTQLGTDNQLDCDWKTNFNAGCGVKYPDSPPSFGPEFNKNGGGWYAMERTETHISLWFWERHAKNVPFDVKTEGFLADPSKWGLPDAFFPNTQCDFNKFFDENNIIINLTLCGDWAGQEQVWKSSGCSATLNCTQYVDNNPGAFKDAFFDFKSVRVYEPQGHVPPHYPPGHSRRALSHQLGAREIH